MKDPKDLTPDDFQRVPEPGGCCEGCYFQNCECRLDQLSNDVSKELGWCYGTIYTLKPEADEAR